MSFKSILIFFLDSLVVNVLVRQDLKFVLYNSSTYQDSDMIQATALSLSGTLQTNKLRHFDTMTKFPWHGAGEKSTLT